jgi:hypothetical protein
MVKSDDRALALTRCAEAVDRELSRFEELARSARNIKLSSEKSIVRAARGLQQALEQQERLAAELRAFGQSMLGMQTRQEAATLSLQARATEIQARMARHAELMERFQALGLRAKDAVGALVALSPGTQGAGEAMLTLDAGEQLRQLVDEARAVAEVAKADDFPEISGEAHALEQRVRAMGERLAELVRAKSIQLS